MSRWRSRALIGVALVVVLGAAGVIFLMVSDTTTPVDVDDAVGRYREEVGADELASTTTAARGQALPGEGVYVYATEGHDAIDILGGATHTYPAETTLTVTHTACGFRQRWQPLEERWDDEEVCVSDAGRERRALDAHHEFFGMSDDESFACDPGYVLLPADPEPGTTWTTSCQSAGSGLTGRGEVVGVEVRQVGAESVDTVHVRIEEEASGSNTGPSRDDYWLRASDGLLIERVSSVDTRSETPVGTATYTERFTLRLASLEAQT
jgi:hypothetical protein